MKILIKLFAVSAILGVVFTSTGCKIPEEGYVPGPPTFFGTTFISLEDAGYEQKEYFIKGSATSYTSEEPLPTDGKWTVTADETADFKTRMVVYTPADPAHFNGTVILEWLNVSGGTDASSVWIMAHTELIRKGYAWVGITAQRAGIEGGGINLLGFGLPLKNINPFRYSTLKHPGDKFAYDIFHQAAKAVIEPENFKPLGDLNVKRAIAAGESQSADFLLTYMNAVTPRENLFDAYFIHSRVHGSQPLSPIPASGDRAEGFDHRDTMFLRDDLNIPTIILQTESDLTVLGAYPDRQEDSDFIRTWEVAGTAHADRYVGNVGLIDRGTSINAAAVVETKFAIPLLVECEEPINSGPQHFVVKAAIAALDNWVQTDIPPTPAERLLYDEATESYVRDSLGNVIGGVRTPYVDAPIAQLTGESDTDDLFCAIYGKTKLFDDATLAQLYADHETYVQAVDDSLQAAIANGFILEADGELIKAWAEQSDIGR